MDNEIACCIKYKRWVKKHSNKIFKWIFALIMGPSSQSVRRLHPFGVDCNFHYLSKYWIQLHSTIIQICTVYFTMRPAHFYLSRWSNGRRKKEQHKQRSKIKKNDWNGASLWKHRTKWSKASSKMLLRARGKKSFIRLFESKSASRERQSEQFELKISMFAAAQWTE